MPRKRTHAKRRSDELEAWRNMFECGYDFFHDLRFSGVPLNLIGDPTNEAAAEAWARLGSRFIAEHGRETDTGATLWALAQFGEPQHAG